jgi:hypothetical protein
MFPCAANGPQNGVCEVRTCNFDLGGSIGSPPASTSWRHGATPAGRNLTPNFDAGDTPGKSRPHLCQIQARCLIGDYGLAGAPKHFLTIKNLKQPRFRLDVRRSWFGDGGGAPLWKATSVLYANRYSESGYSAAGSIGFADPSKLLASTRQPRPVSRQF